ncbi:MAG: hypothetical protein K2Q14_03260 [Gammaproteobacteria bacterium]|nr:hypothetical protein [Gammaproteobacteria bacterium]
MINSFIITFNFIKKHLIKITVGLLCMGLILSLSACGHHNDKMTKATEFVASVKQAKGGHIEPLPIFFTPSLPEHRPSSSAIRFCP